MYKNKQYKLVILVCTTVHIAQLILYFLPIFVSISQIIGAVCHCTFLILWHISPEGFNIH